MQLIVGIICAVTAVVLVIIARSYKRKVFEEEYANFLENPDSYTLVIETKDSKQTITNLIINTTFIEEEISKKDLLPENFIVCSYKNSIIDKRNIKEFESKQDTDSTQTNVSKTEKNIYKIQSVYFCDIDGNRIPLDTEEENNATHLLIKLEDSCNSLTQTEPAQHFVIKSKLFAKQITTSNEPIIRNK